MEVEGIYTRLAHGRLPGCSYVMAKRKRGNRNGILISRLFLVLLRVHSMPLGQSFSLRDHLPAPKIKVWARSEVKLSCQWVLRT